MKGYVVSYFLGVASVVAPLAYLYVKGFFKEWVKTTVVTIDGTEVHVEPKKEA